MSLLMQPGRLNKLELKNRIMMAPMGTTLNGLNERYVEYYIERARGGAAIVTCNMMVSENFEDTSSTMTLNDENIHLFRAICDGVHAFGAKVCAQMMPGCGRIAGPAEKKGYQVPVSASACGWLYAPEVPCHELTIDEIHELEDEFRRTAKLAIGAGADIIEIHAYGGYLNDQFLTRAWNKRSDEYGGSLEGRMRFLKNQMDIVKEVGGPDFPLLIKFCPDHCFPENPEQRAIEEGIELSKKMEEYGADGLHVDAGCYERWYLAIPPGDIQEMNAQSRSAKIVRENVKIPVLTHGRFANVEKAESALRNGICDFAVIGRGLLADPFLPNKILENRVEDILPCISCNEGCIYSCVIGREVTCAVNPRVNREDGSRDIPKAKAPGKVLVVGAGPGGCSAALYAKAAGHEVEIWEKGGQIGGNAFAASQPYFKFDMHALFNYYAVQLAKAGIPVRYFTEATPGSVRKFGPDKVIWAAGGAPMLPKAIPGLDLPNVYTVSDALKNLVPLGKRLVFIGGGQAGVEAALHFDKMDYDVTVVEMAEKILPQEMFVMNESLLRDMMAKSGINWMPGTKLVSIEGDYMGNRVTVENAEGRKVLECDTVIMAMGFSPTTDKADELRDICEVICIGDSVEAGKIFHAVSSAWDAVRQLSL